jgi:plasmid stabilization system protein ParE
MSLSIAHKSAENFRKAFDNACELLLHTPEMGSHRGFYNPALDDLRMMRLHNFKNYLIFYRPAVGRRKLPDRQRAGIKVVVTDASQVAIWKGKSVFCHESQPLSRAAYPHLDQADIRRPTGQRH